jgi:hypothetical protein
MEDLNGKIESTQTIKNGGKFDRMLMWRHGNEEGVGGFTKREVRAVAQSSVKEGGEVRIVGCGQYKSDWDDTFSGSGIRVGGVYPGRGLEVTNVEIFNYIINTVGVRNYRIIWQYVGQR